VATAVAQTAASTPAPQLATDSVKAVAAPAQAASNQATWSPEAEKELGKIPFFVRGKARRNTERFAQDLGVATITVETLYDAKAHFSR
jgi:light-independent protochlorophyllide reductase subunit B